MPMMLIKVLVLSLIWRYSIRWGAWQSAILTPPSQEVYPPPYYYDPIISVYTVYCSYFFPATDSPRSWLHLIEDLDLLHDQASNQNNSPHEANHKSKSAADFNISQPQPNVISTASDIEKSNMADGCPRKPLIQPAKLRVRKRRFSISSATAALSLTGNGWSFGDHVINKANGHSVNSEAPNPFLQVPDTTHSRGMNVRRNSAIIERPRVNYFQQRRTNHHSLAHFANGIGLTNHKHNTSQDSCKILSLSRLNHFNSHTTPPPNNQPWQQQSLSSSLISSSHLPCPSNQLQSTGTPAAAVNSRPRSNRVRCVVVALVLFSVTGNVVLLLLLIMHVYKPSSQALSPVWAEALSNL